MHFPIPKFRNLCQSMGRKVNLSQGPSLKVRFRGHSRGFKKGKRVPPFDLLFMSFGKLISFEDTWQECTPPRFLDVCLASSESFLCIIFPFNFPRGRGWAKWLLFKSFIFLAGLSVVSNMLVAARLTLIRHPGCVCESIDSTGLLMAGRRDDTGDR